MDVTTYLCWDSSQSILVKEAPGVSTNGNHYDTSLWNCTVLEHTVVTIVWHLISEICTFLAGRHHTVFSPQLWGFFKTDRMSLLPLQNTKVLTSLSEDTAHNVDNAIQIYLIRVCVHWDPSYHGITLIPAWIPNYMPSKCGIKLLIHPQTSTVKPLKFGNG